MESARSYLPIRENLVMMSAVRERNQVSARRGEEYDVFSWREIVRCICATRVFSWREILRKKWCDHCRRCLLSAWIIHALGTCF